jgi:hypothetical protein
VLRPCSSSSERRPSSPLLTISTVASFPPSISSAVASMWGKKATAPFFSFSPCTRLRRRGVPSSPATSPTMASLPPAGSPFLTRGRFRRRLSVS